jgi:hypothetical protein
VKQTLNSTLFKILAAQPRLSAAIAVLVIIVPLSACNSTIVEYSPIPATATITPEPNKPVRDPRIQQLLEEAYFAFIESRLTTPVEDNAYFRYLQVLAIDPDSEDANRGISNIVEQYLDWSLESLQNRHFRAATNYLNKARSLDELHPNITAVATRIAEHRKSSEESYLLDPRGLANRSNSTQMELSSIAARMQETRATIIISARNDSEGRWIYQQLNEQTDSRVKARFEQSSKPSIRLFIP